MNNEQMTKDILMYGRYLYDESYNDGLNRDRLVEYENNLYWVEMSKGEITYSGPTIKFEYNNLEVVISLSDQFIRVEEKVFPVLYCEDDFIHSIKKHYIKAHSFKALLKHWLEYKQLFEKLYQV